MISKLYSFWEVIYDGFLGDFINILGTPISELISNSLSNISDGWFIDILSSVLGFLSESIFGSMTLGSFMLGVGLLSVIVLNLFKWLVSILGL